MPCTDILRPRVTQNIFVGEMDAVVSYKYGQLTAQALTTLDVPVEFKSYPRLGHGAEAKEMEDLAAWIRKLLPPV
eukprot:m.489336 g.489336  ORF g.489336 m.489336 type:complete len:75 (+) comp57236_c4_seq6:700-924(+)